MISRPGVIRARDPRWWRSDEFWTWRPVRRIDWLSEADRQAIFADNARKVFNLPV